MATTQFWARDAQVASARWNALLRQGLTHAANQTDMEAIAGAVDKDLCFREDVDAIYMFDGTAWMLLIDLNTVGNLGRPNYPFFTSGNVAQGKFYLFESDTTSLGTSSVRYRLQDHLGADILEISRFNTVVANAITERATTLTTLQRNSSLIINAPLLTLSPARLNLNPSTVSLNNALIGVDEVWVGAAGNTLEQRKLTFLDLGDTPEAYADGSIARSGSNGLYLGTLDLGDLADVSSTAPTDGQALLWNATAAEWRPGTVAASGPTGGLNQAAVDARVRALVANFAEQGYAQNPFPANDSLRLYSGTTVYASMRAITHGMEFLARTTGQTTPANYISFNRESTTRATVQSIAGYELRVVGAGLRLEAGASPSKLTILAPGGVNIGGVDGVAGQYIGIGSGGELALLAAPSGGGMATPLSTTLPLADGTAAAGTATSAARGDHIHPQTAQAQLHADTVFTGSFTGSASGQDIQSGGSASNLNIAVTVGGQTASLRRVVYAGDDTQLIVIFNGINLQAPLMGHALELNGRRYLIDQRDFVTNAGGQLEFRWNAATGAVVVGNNTISIYEPIDDDNLVPGGASENEIMTFNSSGSPVNKDMTADVLLAGSGETVVTGRIIETGTQNADGSYSLRTRAATGQGGVGGQSGLSRVVPVTLWRRATSTPSAPTGGVWDNGWTTVPTDWHASPSGPTGSNTLYVARAAATDSGSTWTIGAWTVSIAEEFNTRYSIYLNGRDSANNIVATTAPSSATLAYNRRGPNGQWGTEWIPLYPVPGFTPLGSISVNVATKTTIGHMSFGAPVDLARIADLRFRLQLEDSSGSAHMITNFDLDPGAVWVAPFNAASGTGLALNRSLVAIADDTSGLFVMAGNTTLPSTNASVGAFACRFLIRQTTASDDAYSNAGDIYIYEWGGTGQYGSFAVSYR